MSRSRRRTPVVANTTALSEKRDEILAHRSQRCATRMALKSGREAPDRRAFGDPWKGDKDGKRYLADLAPVMMRK